MNSYTIVHLLLNLFVIGHGFLKDFSCVHFCIYSTGNVGENTVWSIQCIVWRFSAHMTYYSCQNTLRVHLLGYYCISHNTICSSLNHFRDVDLMMCPVVLHMLDSLLWFIRHENIFSKILYVHLYAGWYCILIWTNTWDYIGNMTFIILTWRESGFKTKNVYTSIMINKK